MDNTLTKFLLRNKEKPISRETRKKRTDSEISKEGRGCYVEN